MEEELKPMLGIQEVCDYLNVHPKTIKTLLEGDRNFPKPIVLGPKMKRWKKEEIVSWVENQR
jgi:predicted DNA-binding transcriptional regulator AlpA